MEYGDEFDHCDAPDSVDSEDGGKLLKLFSPNYVFNAQLSLLNWFSLNLSLYICMYICLKKYVVIITGFI
jgi:hypothetical protein